MKTTFLFLFLASFFLVRSQDDTLLINEFSFQAYDDTILPSGDTAYMFDLIQTNKANVEYQEWETRSDMRAIANTITDGAANYLWFDDQLWRNWHIIPYTESIDTIVGVDTVTYDTTSNFGLRSFSWFETPQQAHTVLLTPPVFIKDNTAKLYWKSMPVQGPRHQDGYKVYVLDGQYNDLDNVPFLTLEPDFAMQELDVSVSAPVPTITSLAELEEDFGFIPEDGTAHTRYTLPDTNELGDIDSTRQNPFMQQFELDLSDKVGHIQIAFVHDSYNNNAIILDDILIKGTGSIGVDEVKKGELKIYPNPVEHTLFIDSEFFQENATVEVFDLGGRLIFQDKLNTNKGLDLSSLSPGQYLIKLKSEKGVFTQNFTKVK